MQTEYEPTIIDIIWAMGLIKKVPDEKTKTFPRTNMQYKFHQLIRVLELLNIEELQEEINQETHERTRKVFKLLGWETLP